MIWIVLGAGKTYTMLGNEEIPGNYLILIDPIKIQLELISHNSF